MFRFAIGPIIRHKCRAMLSIGLYFGCGIGAYLLMRLLFRKTNMDRKGLTNIWWGEPLVLIFWPLALFMSLVWWLIAFDQIKARRKGAEAAATQPQREHLSTDDLIARQKKAVAELVTNQAKNTNAR